jgi:OmpA-OmpF porin, OOP family
MKNVMVRSSVSGAVLLAIGMVSAPTVAVAGFYVEADVGTSDFDISRSEIDDTLLDAFEDEGLDVLNGQSDLDKSSTRASFAVGYQFTPNLAVEAGFVDLGRIQYDSSGLVDGGEGNIAVDVQLKAKTSGPALSVIGAWPLNDRFALEGRVGAYFGKTRATATASAALDPAENVSVSDSDTDTSMLLGVGAVWTTSESIALRLGYTRFDKALGGEQSVDRISFAVRYSF